MGAAQRNIVIIILPIILRVSFLIGSRFSYLHFIYLQHHFYSPSNCNRVYEINHFSSSTSFAWHYIASFEPASHTFFWRSITAEGVTRLGPWPTLTWRRASKRERLSLEWKIHSTSYTYKVDPSVSKGCIWSKYVIGVVTSLPYK